MAAPIAVDLLRSSVINPVFLSLCSHSRRMNDSELIILLKGIWTPFAYLVTGIMLWAFDIVFSSMPT